MEDININISYNSGCNRPSFLNRLFDSGLLPPSFQPSHHPSQHPTYHPSHRPYLPLHKEVEMLFENGEYLVPLVVGKEQRHLYAALSTNSPDIVLIDKTCKDSQGQSCLSNQKYGDYDYQNSISCVTVPYNENCKSQNTMKCSKLTNLGKYEHVDTKRIQEDVTEITVCDLLNVTNRYTKMRVAIKIEPKPGMQFSPQPSIIGLSPNNTSGIKYFHVMFDAQKPTITFDDGNKLIIKKPKARLMPIDKSYKEYYTAYTGYVNQITYNGINLSNYLDKKNVPVTFASGNTFNILPTKVFNIVIKNIEKELDKILGGKIILNTQYDVFFRGNNPLSATEVANKQDEINKIPPLILKFKTKSGKIFKWAIRDYITIMKGFVRSMFMPHGANSKTPEFIILGNTGMFGKELSFDSTKSEPIVSIY